jgi:aspartate/methionine/tyrosine aminotransferase
MVISPTILCQTAVEFSYRKPHSKHEFCHRCRRFCQTRLRRVILSAVNSIGTFSPQYPTHASMFCYISCRKEADWIVDRIVDSEPS